MERHYRAWINQPSTLQPVHHMHGKICIVIDDGDDYITAHFTEGVTHSMIIPRSALVRVKISSAED